MIKVALVDDHTLLRSGLAGVVNSFGEYNIIFEADNGRQFIELLTTNPMPEIVLLDINMPLMDGFATALWIKNNQPDIKVLVLTMDDDDTSIIKMLQHNAKGYILKDCKPQLLRHALNEVFQKGFYFNDIVSGKLANAINRKSQDAKEPVIMLTDKETEFLKWCATEKTYKEIADVMHISIRAVEALRSNLFEKLETTSRVGLVMYSIRNEIIKV